MVDENGRVLAGFQLPRMDKPSGTSSGSSNWPKAMCFNFPGWINHPEPESKLASDSARSVFQLPRMDKPSGTLTMPQRVLGPRNQFQLPRMDKPSGTRPGQPAKQSPPGFNFPGWINHPEPIKTTLFGRLKHNGFNFPGWINHPEPAEARRRQGPGDVGFNFPGWINHPELPVPVHHQEAPRPVSTSPDG